MGQAVSVERLRTQEGEQGDFVIKSVRSEQEREQKGKPQEQMV